MTIAKDLQLLIGAIAVALFSCLVSEPSSARIVDFLAPETIAVTMYELTANGAPIMRCDPGNGNLTRWGCTAYCDNPGNGISCASPVSSYPWSYPNPYQNPVTVQIEGATVTNRYLRDVVSQETSPALFHATAVGAQAIAARTYAYWHIRTDDVTPGPLDNSRAYQVFVPYRYDTFGQGERDIVDAALQGRYYLSNISDYTVNLYGHTVNLTAEDPIFAEFFADRPLETLSNPPHPNLVGVADPISSHPDVPSDGHGHGLSQDGAGRWTRGSSSYRCDPYPAPCPPPAPSVPFFAWSVSWPERFQLLTHYYTAVHVRDAANGNAIVTPTWRGAVLQVAWARPRGYPDGICSRIEVWLQNSGTSP
ncbi:MAG: SpoIID/LytB domain-containing protein [Chloroflexi bacterium]|nr:SpoIID/LytB domain-containing protein [Chloroflexota bacterium]